MEKRTGISQTDKIFSLTSISFDAMVMNLFSSCFFGACIVYEDTRRDGALLKKQ
jgi:hypothetical protein